MKQSIHTTVLLIMAILLSCPSAVGQVQTRTIQKKRTSHAIIAAYPLKNIKINSPFGYRTDPFTGKRKMHNGLDLHARNDEVYSMLCGTVVKVGNDMRSGIYVTIAHGDITVSYCHLSRALVAKGTIVRPGSVVGITGNTGRSTGEHLHISCKIRNKYVNPILIIAHIKKWRMLA